MSIRTNRCIHCGKKKEEHYGADYMICCSPLGDTIYRDSGLALLQEHAEELYEAAKSFIESHSNSEYAYDLENWSKAVTRLEEVLNQIEKEK